MSLDMPEMDARVGKCGAPGMGRNSTGVCNKAGVVRVMVTVAEHPDDDMNYEVHDDEFRAFAGWEVMVDLCEKHRDETANYYAEMKAQVDQREAEKERAAAKIREAKAAYNALVEAYPGTWYEE